MVVAEQGPGLGAAALGWWGGRLLRTCFPLTLWTGVVKLVSVVDCSVGESIIQFQRNRFATVAEGGIRHQSKRWETSAGLSAG